jgi:hypothetical protein
LANAATIAAKPSFGYTAILQAEIDMHDIAAEGVVVFMGMRRVGHYTPMVRFLVVVEHVLLIDFFFVGAAKTHRRNRTFYGRGNKRSFCFLYSV